MTHVRFQFLPVLFASLLLGICQIARAELGELQANSSWWMHKATFASVNTSNQGNAQVRSFVDNTGLTVNEYFQGKRKIFAVGWQGPVKPNLGALLGRYFAQYKSMQSTNKGLNTPLQGSSGELVLEESGHMRAFSGFAYVPALLPSNVDINSLAQ